MNRRQALFAAVLLAGSAITRVCRAVDRADGVEASAERIAQDLADQPIFEGFGIDLLLPLLSALLPALLKCLFPQPAPPTAQQIKAFAAKAWNERRQGYDAHTVRRLKVQAKRKAKGRGKLLSDEQATSMATEILDHARLGEDAHLKAFSKAAWASDVKAATED